MTTVALDLHLEEADGEAVWWAASDDVPGFTALAGSLAGLRSLATEALPGVRLTERLVGGPVVIVGPLSEVPDVPPPA